MQNPLRSAALLASASLGIFAGACSSDSSESNGAATTGGVDGSIGGAFTSMGGNALQSVGGSGGTTDVGGGSAASSTGGSSLPNTGGTGFGGAPLENTGGFGATNTGGSGTPSGFGGTATGGSVGSSGGFGSGGNAGSTGSATGGNTDGSGGSTDGSGGSTDGSGGNTDGSGGSTDGSGGSTDGSGGNTDGSGGNTDGSGGTTAGNCTFTVDAQTSTAIPTVGIVNWSADLANINHATIEFGPENSDSVLEAPVDLSETSGAGYRTLLLGMKQQNNYVFRIVLSSDSTSCTSDDYPIATGQLSIAPQITQQVSNAAAAVGGFIVTSGGLGGGMPGGGGGSAPTIIIDADGDVVWASASPGTTSRAHMSYDGQAMWMLGLNVNNSGGEMRWVSMDGLDGQNNVSGLSAAHHDFCVVDDNSIAALVWSASGQDPPSDLIERAPDGTLTTIVRDSNAYQSSSYHVNSVHYFPWEDSYILGDRNPNLYVNVTRQGQVVWQFGGDCTNAPAPACASGSWQVNHGLDWDQDGNFIFFNNGSGTSTSTIYKYQLTVSGNALTATPIWQYPTGSGGTSSMVLGDVQYLPNGNVLITYSTSGSIVELDSQRALVRSLSSTAFGYADWRETLYGPPSRL